MPSPRKTEELKRLQNAFESEAAQFHDTSLSIFYFTQEEFPIGRKFRSPNHMVMLWQYYGRLSDDEAQIKQFVENLQTSDIKRAGVRGSNFSCSALVEGVQVERFVRMATRAGSVFSENEAQRIRMRASKDFKSNLPKEKSIFIANTNPVSSGSITCCTILETPILDTCPKQSWTLIHLQPPFRRLTNCSNLARSDQRGAARN